MRRKLYSEDVTYGRNATTTPNRDAKFIRCFNCGFMCNLDRDNRHRIGSQAGDGNNYDTTFYTTSDSGWGREEYGDEIWGGARELRYDPDSQSGCPMCGTLIYDR